MSPMSNPSPGSFTETLAGWAEAVVTGRARLGGIPVGIVATEGRMREKNCPADPADMSSHERIVQQVNRVDGCLCACFLLLFALVTFFKAIRGGGGEGGGARLTLSAVFCVRWGCGRNRIVLGNGRAILQFCFAVDLLSSWSTRAVRAFFCVP